VTSFAERLANAKPRTETVPIHLDGSLVNEHEAAVRALAAATQDDDSLASTAVQAAAAAVTAIEERMEADAEEFILSSVSREEWAGLLAEFPPTKEERRAGHDHDPKKFPPAAVAACVVQPEGFTRDDAVALAKSKAVPSGEFNKLWMAALRLNVTGTPSPKLSAATEILRANEQSSTIADLEASLGEGSLAGSGAQ
jgi:hypothetical protein